MKKYHYIILLSLLIIAGAIAKNKLFITKLDGSVFLKYVSAIDSIKFSDSDNKIIIHNTNKTTQNYIISNLNNLVFDKTEQIVTISYSGTSVIIDNPYSTNGVTISSSGANVTVNSSTTESIVYRLTGSTTNGGFKIYSDSEFEIQLQNASITNSSGAALNIQSKKTASVLVMAGTTNTLCDALIYTSGTEDEKGTIFSEGMVNFVGYGTLNISSLSKNAICCDDSIAISGPKISISSAAKDALHAKGLLQINNGTVQTSATGDGLDCEQGSIEINGGTITASSPVYDTKCIKCDSAFTITGGSVNLTVSGDMGKGIKSGGIISLNGGNITITTSGAALSTVSGSGYDMSYCTAIKGDSLININGASVTITATGAGGKGISASRDITISAGSLNISTTGNGTTYTNSSGVKDSYNATCITSDQNISIVGGTIVASSSGTGGKGLKANRAITIGSATGAPDVTVTTTGAKFTVSSSTSSSSGPGGSSTTYDYCHPKTIVCDGAFSINNGKLTISSTDDAIHSELSATFNGGTTNIKSSVEGVESLTITFNGGVTTIIGSDDALNATAGAVAGGSESDDGSYIYMKGGILIASATSGDAIDSNGKFLMTGGVLASFGPANSTNEDIDVNGSVTINGGVFMGASYSSNMFETISSSSQYGVNIKSSSAIASAGSYFRVQNSSGSEIGTFITPRAGYYLHVASPLMTKSTSYNIYTGGTYTGGTTYGSTSGGGYCTGGTYSGGTLKKTFSTGTSYITTTN